MPYPAIINEKCPECNAFRTKNERGEGLCKIIVDAQSHKVLGVHMLGNPCSEIIQNYTKRTDRNLSRLSEYAKILRSEKSMKEYMTITLGE